ncbi:phage tail sheath family protein [Variovorax sp. J31P179]|uniref:phage tail sheath family protein n=1 Tax=Variovorax sp. J31P179 TaxID=3053508 RepID=UPI002576A71A|nr:phage tail sheath family protein [Variovorax sp. J31P179]MDM0085082.1 phage tail sheath family protein [Variovorax sp. J31P179]
MVTSYKEYSRYFGGVFGEGNFLPYAASGFFENGGKRLFVCRLVDQDATPAQADAGDFFLRAAGAGSWGKRVWARVGESITRDKNNIPVGFRLRVAYFAEGDEIYDPFDSANDARSPRPYVEDYNDLVVNEKLPDYYGKRLNFIDMDKGPKNQGPDASALIVLVRKSGVAAGVAPAAFNGLLADQGEDGGDLDVTDYAGAVAGQRAEEQGLAALELDPYREVALVYAPDVDPATRLAIIGHCERMRFRFAVIDASKGSANPTGLDPRTTITDSSYASFYYPWLAISDPSTGARKIVPPGGHMLGVFARTDVERGVFKAPANEIVRGALDLEYDINDAHQETLNPRGVNAIRRFPGRGIRVWGARTLASNSLWKYVPVRRLFIFIERSIYEGTQWVVFEPNEPKLWARVSDTTRLFLRTQWREGALFGRKEEEAFHITCDETVMSRDDILNGKLICEIGIAPVRPAEFVIFRIFQNTAEAPR